MVLRRLGKTVKLDGGSLSLPAIVVAARFPSSSFPNQHGNVPHVVLAEDPTTRSRVDNSRQVIDSKMAAGKSIYGVSTGFGGSGRFISQVIFSSSVNAVNYFRGFQARFFKKNLTHFFILFSQYTHKPYYLPWPGSPAAPAYRNPPQ